MDTLSLLLSTPYAPPFIYLHHPHQPTTSLDFPPRASQARVDAIECHTPKILWSAIISRLDGERSDAGLVDSLDGFVRTLKSVGTGRTSVKGKGKGKEKEEEWGRQAISIVITKAERLPKVMGSGWAVMTRLAELVGPGSLWCEW
jgi:origin recognition complex subunit 5